MLGKVILHLGGGQRRQCKRYTARPDGGQQLSRILCQQEDNSIFRWLLKHFQQGVGRLLDESRIGKDEYPAPGLGRFVMDGGDHVSHLVNLDHHLGRVRGDYQHVRMGLHQDAGFALVSLAQPFAGLHGLGKAAFQIFSLADAGTV